MDFCHRNWIFYTHSFFAQGWSKGRWGHCYNGKRRTPGCWKFSTRQWHKRYYFLALRLGYFWQKFREKSRAHSRVFLDRSCGCEQYGLQTVHSRRLMPKKFRKRHELSGIWPTWRYDRQMWHSGWRCYRYLNCVQDSWATRREEAGEIHGGAKRRRRSNLGKPWGKYHGNKIGGVNGRRNTRSRSQGGAEK